MDNLSTTFFLACTAIFSGLFSFLVTFGTPPFCPGPLGIPVIERFDKFGEHLFVASHSVKRIRIPLASAASTVCEQTLYAAYIGHLVSDLTCPINLVEV